MSDKAARLVTHGDVASGRYVRIAVSDTGRGMDEVTFERSFEPCFDTRVDGSGLGLATMRKIVREHDGLAPALVVENSAVNVSGGMPHNLELGARVSERWSGCKRALVDPTDS